MAKQHTQINPSRHQRSTSKDSRIKALQQWKPEHEAFLASVEENRDLMKQPAPELLAPASQPASAAFVIEINAESDAPALERHPSFIPVSSPVHSAAVGSMQLQFPSEASVNLGGESLVQNLEGVIFI